MKGSIALILLAAFFVSPNAFAQAPIPPCPCDTAALNDGTTGNDIVEALCPGGQLIEGADFGLNPETVIILSDTLSYGADSSPNNSICRITEFNIDGLDLDISDQQAALCRVSLIERCSLNSTPIPTLSEWGMISMAGLLGIIGLYVALRRRKAAA